MEPRRSPHCGRELLLLQLPSSAPPLSNLSSVLEKIWGYTGPIAIPALENRLGKSQGIGAFHLDWGGSDRLSVGMSWLPSCVKVISQPAWKCFTRSPVQNLHPAGSIRLLSTPAKPRTKLPLEGIKILDLSRVLAGPFCTQILADYGADVLKIEQPDVGDETRQWRTDREAQKWKDEYPLMSLYYAAINRNKRSMTVNLKDGRGLAIIKELAKETDVMVNNFLPGKMEKMGLGWEEMKEINPGLVYASVSGYGASGPSSKRAGYDAIALAEAGMLHITGEPTGPPTKPGVAIADLCTGLYAHGAILAGLRQRDVTGEGCKIDGSLFETSLSLLINVGLASMNLDIDNGPDNRRRGKRMGLGHAALVPYGAFKTKEGRYFFLAANNNRQWNAFCKKMNIPGLADDKRFQSNDRRVEHREEINSTLQRRFSEMALPQWLQEFEGSGLPYGPINDVVEALEDKQSRARGMVMDIKGFEAARDGILKIIGPAVKFEGLEMGVVRRKPPLLGEHTDEVLREMGREAEIEALRKEGAV